MKWTTRETVRRHARRGFDEDQTRMYPDAEDGVMDALIAALRDPACYPHPAAQVELIETHISWVLLAGDYAYKLKKPVRLPFLDFGTLEARRHFCAEELRLNRRTAAALYLEVVPVVQSARGPRVGGGGEAIEYAVKMRRFSPEALADAMARRGALGPAQADEIAAALARFHADAPCADRASPYGTAADVAAQAVANFDQIGALVPAPDAPLAARLARLRAWTGGEAARLAAAFAARRAGGFVRECHGDLHLANIAFVGGRALPFDCIEFDPGLRWIDVMSEMAFLFMDLRAHGLAGLAWRALNGWLEASGDYEGVEVLRFYAVYRAMVRAKVACIRGERGAFDEYVALAEELAGDARAALVVMHGVSGSGKTTVSRSLAERLGAVRLRSDVERKRLAGISPGARAAAPPGEGIYGAGMTGRTYGRLARLAALALEAGVPAIVDAATLRRAERDALRRLAERRGAPCVIAACEAPEAVLRARVAARAAQGRDASDAGPAVLERQLATREPLGTDEETFAVRVDGATEAGALAALGAVAARLDVARANRAPRAADDAAQALG
jgi:aminoglycoside phosphotransferase family enzyme/predicted kinase